MKSIYRTLLHFLLAGVVPLLVQACDFSRPYTDNVVNGTITVPPGTYTRYSVYVSDAMESPRLRGNFTASGGSGNDIRVYVMDAMNFVNWSNGHSATSLYSSGQTTTGAFNVELTEAGTYYVIYDNTFSVISSKRVTTRVDFDYRM